MKIKAILLSVIFAATLIFVSCKSTEQDTTLSDVVVADSDSLANEKSGKTDPFTVSNLTDQNTTAKANESASANENSGGANNSTSSKSSASNGSSNLGITTPEAAARAAEEKAAKEAANGIQSENDSSEGQTATREPQEGELLLNGKLYTKEEIEARGGVSIWDCYGNEKNSSNKILWTFGYFNDSKDRGFMLKDGGRTGTEDEVYHRVYDGNERWNWAPDKNDYFEYSFIIEPDTNGYYYQFPLEPHVASPKTTYKTKKR